MARLQMLRRISNSFSNSFSLDCLSVTCRGFASNSCTFRISSLVNNETTSKVVFERWGLLGHGKAQHLEASGIRALSGESSGKGGEGEPEEPHQETKIDGGKKYSVVQIDNDGSWRTVWRNALEIVST